ncbi:MAG: LytTR family DNA-binding domain-containing protein [Clostridia bacterium]|nr:LytTR family DNA-binding domain-containing protein [Clostridia bacterium]
MNVGILNGGSTFERQFTAVINKFSKRVGLEMETEYFDSAEKVLNCGKRQDILILGDNNNKKAAIPDAVFLRQNNFKGELVFASRDRKGVLESFSVKPFDFLLLPISIEDFNNVLFRFVKFLKEKECLFLKFSGKEIYINFKNIIYIRSDVNGSMIRCKNKIIRTPLPLYKIEPLLPQPLYCRCHRSHIINLAYIKSVGKDVIYLGNGETLSISRRKIGDFNRSVEKYNNIRNLYGA